MDWYYPVLAGAITGDEAGKRIDDGWDTFVMEGKGVRCVSDRPWVTAAETCECAMAVLAAGERERATDLFTWAQALRDARRGLLHRAGVPGADPLPGRRAVQLHRSGRDPGRRRPRRRSNPTSTLFTEHPASPALSDPSSASSGRSRR